MSFGGMLACHWVAQYPEDFSSLVLINTSAADLSPIFDRMYLNSMRSLLKVSVSRKLELREKKILEIVSNKEVGPKLLDSWVSIQKTAPVSYLTLLSQLYLASKFKIKDLGITIPCLVIYSERDKLVSPKASKAIIKHLNANSLKHQTAGHDIAIDDPMWLKKSILNFTTKGL